MSQSQISFIEKIKNWLKSLFQKKETVMETVEEIIEVIEAVEKVEQVSNLIKPRPSRKVRDISKTIDATIAQVRGASVSFDEAANLSEKTIEVVETVGEVVMSFKKGRFDETEITTIQNAIDVAGKLEVDWNTLSANLNRDIKSIKAKAKLLSK